MEEYEFPDSPRKNAAETGSDTGEVKAATDSDGFMNVSEGEEFPFE